MKTLLLLAATATFAAAQQCSNFLTEEDKSMDTWLYCLENLIKFEDPAPSGYEWGKGLPTNNKRKKRFIKDTEMRFEWPNGRVPYNISCDFNKCQRAQIAQAMAMFHEDTCISFEPATGADAVSAGGVLRITRDDFLLNAHGDYRKAKTVSSRSYNFYHNLRLANSALDGYSFIVLHEFYHSLGFLHEHERPDRPVAEYVGAPTESPSNIVTLGPFDVNSISHYRIGLRNDLSAVLSYSDVWRINKLYNCTRTTNGKPIILSSQQPDVNIVRPEPTYATKTPNSCTQANKKQKCESGYLYIYDRSTKTIKKTETRSPYRECMLEVDGKRALLGKIGAKGTGAVCATGVIDINQAESRRFIVTSQYHRKECDVVVESDYTDRPQIVCLKIPGDESATTATTTTTAQAITTTAQPPKCKPSEQTVDYYLIHNYDRSTKKLVQTEERFEPAGFNITIDGIRVNVAHIFGGACSTYRFADGVLKKTMDRHDVQCDLVVTFGRNLNNIMCLQVGEAATTTTTTTPPDECLNEDEDVNEIELNANNLN